MKTFNSVCTYGIGEALFDNFGWVAWRSGTAV